MILARRLQHLIEPVKMDFHYGTSFNKATPEAYERLLLDTMSGDTTLFARAMKSKRRGNTSMPSEPNGTRILTISPSTPQKLKSCGADDLIRRYGATWRRL